MNTQNREIVNLGGFSKVLNSFFVYTGDESDNAVQACCKKLGIWEQEETEWMIKNIQPGWKCLDIGANNGYFTEVMARIVGKTGEVIAFEPLKHLNDNYQISTKLNNYDHAGKITMYQYALSNKNYEATMLIPFENIGASTIIKLDFYNNEPNDKYTVEKVKAIRLDSIYDETPDFIKIDVEGHEEKVFDGMHNNTKKCKLIMMEVGHNDNKFLQKIYIDYDIFYLNGDRFDINNIPRKVFNIILKRKS